MRKLSVCLVCAAGAACAGKTTKPPPSGPYVDSLMPTSGLWGSEITIAGAGFGGTAASSGVAFPGVGAAGFLIDDWSNNEIRGRVAFPATGDVTVHTAGGQADAGTFTTQTPWAPSGSFDVDQLVDGVVLSTGDVAAVYHQYEVANQAALAVFTGAHVGAFPLDNLVDPADPSVAVAAKLVEADDHSPEVIATRHDGSVVAITLAGGSATATPTGLTGTVLAAARDATGVYAWLATSSGVERVRPGATWSVDRGPISAAMTPLDGAVAADGTLWILVSEPAASSRAYASVQTLAPTATMLGGPERADPNSYSDHIARGRVTLAADGVHALVVATAMAGTTPMDLAPRVRSAASQWANAPAVTGLVQYAFLGSTLAAITNDATNKLTSLVPDATMPATATTIPVWPMLSSGIVVDGAGKPHPLLSNGSVTYALAPPS